MKKRFLNFIQLGSLAMSMIFLATFTSCDLLGGEDEETVPDPVASFQVAVSETNFLEVTFTNFSQNAVSYEWNMGDGNEYFTENVTHEFAAAGTYSVALVAVNEAGTKSAPFTQDVNITDPNATLSFIAGAENNKVWYLQREGVALGIGPVANDNAWWSFGGVTPLGARPCILDDSYTFSRDGGFAANTNGTIFIDSEGNGGWHPNEGCWEETNPDVWGSNPNRVDFAAGSGYTFELNNTDQTLTILGSGAYIGLPNKTENGDNTDPVSSKVFKIINMGSGDVADSLTLSLVGDGFAWNFYLVSYANESNLPPIPSLNPVNVTFSVDMSAYTGSYTNVYVSGAFNDWSGTANQMTDDDSDGIYTTTIELVANTYYEYKFTLDDWADQDMFTEADACAASTDGNGQFWNRNYTTGVNDFTLEVQCFQKCGPCSVDAPTEKYNLFSSTDATDEVGLTYNAGSTSIVTPGTADPAGGSTAVALYVRSENQYADSQFDFGGDQSLANFTTISMDVYFPSSNDYAGTTLNQEVVFYLADRQYGNFWEDWEVHTDGVTEGRTTDQWITITVNLNDDAKTRTNLDFLLIKIGGDNHTADGTFYVRNLKFQ